MMSGIRKLYLKADMTPRLPQPEAAVASSNGRVVKCMRCHLALPSRTLTEHAATCTFAVCLTSQRGSSLKLMEHTDSSVDFRFIGSMQMDGELVGIVSVAGSLSKIVKTSLKEAAATLACMDIAGLVSADGVWRFDRLSSRSQEELEAGPKSVRNIWIDLCIWHTSPFHKLDCLNFSAMRLPNIYQSGAIFRRSPRIRCPLNSTEHGLPPAMARAKGSLSCRETCSTCRSTHCLECPLCPLAIDRNGVTLTVAAMWQPAHTPVKYRAHFLLSGEAMEMAGGMSVCFDGTRNPHGIWTPHKIPSEYTWYSCFLFSEART